MRTQEPLKCEYIAQQDAELEEMLEFYGEYCEMDESVFGYDHCYMVINDADRRACEDAIVWDLRESDRRGVPRVETLYRALKYGVEDRLDEIMEEC